jgi:hypothetical protein
MRRDDEEAGYRRSGSGTRAPPKNPSRLTQAEPNVCTYYCGQTLIPFRREPG